eukprot:759142-Pelagomonas_calceolata.AAC.4
MSGFSSIILDKISQNGFRVGDAFGKVVAAHPPAFDTCGKSSTHQLQPDKDPMTHKSRLGGNAATIPASSMRRPAALPHFILKQRDNPNLKEKGAEQPPTVPHPSSKEKRYNMQWSDSRQCFCLQQLIVVIF